MKRAIDGTMIKYCCLKLKINRLGNISILKTSFSSKLGQLQFAIAINKQMQFDQGHLYYIYNLRNYNSVF